MSEPTVEIPLRDEIDLELRIQLLATVALGLLKSLRDVHDRHGESFDGRPVVARIQRLSTLAPVTNPTPATREKP